MKWASRIGIVALVAGAAVSIGQPAFNAQNVSEDGELVVNGGFENGKSGWRVNNSSNETLAIGSPGHSGSSAATVLAQRLGAITLNDRDNTVGKTKQGTTYTVSAWMRSAVPGLVAQLRIREVEGSKLLKVGGQAVRLTTDWQQVQFSYVTASAGAKLDLNVVGWNIPAGYGFQVDDISMRVAGSTTTPLPDPVASTVAPAPTTSASPTPDGVNTVVPRPGTGTGPVTGTTPGGAAALVDGRLVKNCISARGIPSCGSFMGAAIGGNTDPTAQESKYGKLALRRTYFQASQVSNAVRTAKADLAAGRLPWISFKAPYSWSDMAAGKGDSWARDLAQQLSQLDGPVWVAIHHEPENDGDIKQWVKMQAHLAPIIRSTAPNVAYSIILTGWWDVFGNNSNYTLENAWPGDGLVDIVAFDAYNSYGEVKNGKTLTNFIEMKTYYTPLAAFAKKHHVAWAIGETGYTNAGAKKDSAWLTRAFADMESMGGAGLAYFDSGLNSDGGSFAVDTSAEYSAFKSALTNTVRLAD